MPVLPLNLCRKLLVTDQPIRPEVCHLDGQTITSGFEDAGHIHPERRFPENAQVLAVQAHLREVLHSAKVEHYNISWPDQIRGHVDLPRVLRGTREVLHSRVGMIAPGDKFGEPDTRRRAPT